MREIERVLRRGASTPHTKHHRGELGDHVLEIKRILSTLTPPGSPLNEDLSVGEHSPHIAPCETSASKDGVFLAPPSRSCVKTDCSPILLSQLQTPQPMDVWSDASSPRMNSLP